jgi:hypothetical protein
MEAVREELAGRHLTNPEPAKRHHALISPAGNLDLRARSTSLCFAHSFINGTAAVCKLVMAGRGGDCRRRIPESIGDAVRHRAARLARPAHGIARLCDLGLAIISRDLRSTL